ncbi:hypothetical protein ACFVAF_25625 [Streptomyces sp. NPDC057596]|uniref:hypothetical protein n=1 Tax=Streptomyces sp. NPDC057596 TaxID=3346178 RepID=UPI00368EC2A5
MTRTNLAPPIENTSTNETTLVLRLARLAEAVENLTAMQAADTLELRCFTPAQAAAILGKTENWVVEAIQDNRVPHTYVGKSPRMTAAHIRWVQAQGERLPNKYAKPIAA